MPITNYSIFRAKGGEGQLVVNDSTTEKVGTFNECYNKDTIPLPYGRLVSRRVGGALGEIVLANAATTAANALGISVFYDNYSKALGTDTKPAIPVGYPVTYLRKGIIYMIAETPMTVDQSVFFRINNPTLPIHALGRIRVDADGTNAISITNANGNRVARLLEPALAAGDLVPVQVNFEITLV